MFLIPIFTQITGSLLQYWILLDRNGSACLSLDPGTTALDFATENEIELKEPPIQAGEFTYLVVDPVRTPLAKFYTWAEISPSDLPAKEVWRPFMWSEKDVWGINTYLDSIQCAGKYSIKDVIVGLRGSA